MAKSEKNVRIPQLVSLKVAIKLYYMHNELSNKNIVELFGKFSSATISKLKIKAEGGDSTEDSMNTRDYQTDYNGEVE